ncbi:MAG: hypothetical protein IPK19_34615 [Chloroflexi bacterium]|nr:hypothetical protein [Chloroflexota bacterium]
MSVPIPVQLGPNILVVMENASAFYDGLRTVATRFPDLPHTFFTLFCCCPTHYWEHGGGEPLDVRREVTAAWRAEETAFSQADQCVEHATAILSNAGVPAAHIQSVKSAADNRVNAVIDELRHGAYTGVLLANTQIDLVRRLEAKGMTDRFRHIPKVEFLTLDVETA